MLKCPLNPALLLKMSSQLLATQHRPALGLITAFSLLHLLLAGQVNLSVDEAHYALYGLKLDWSYFDHPPMVGWLNALPAHLLPSDLGMRLIPIALYALSNWLLYRITLRLFSHPKHPQAPWLGFWALVLLNSGIMMQLLSQSMLPDAPLMLFALLTLWQTLNLRQTPSLKNWALLGLWLGLAGLSKYTAITLVFSLILLVLIERRWTWFHWRYQPHNAGLLGFFTAIIIASLLISPVLYWNAQHDWLSILYQLNHGTYNPDWQWSRLIQSQAAQMLVYNPILYLIALYLMLTLSFKTKPDQATANTRLLALFALPVVLLFALNSGYEMTLPHWTQLAWLFMTPAVTFWLWTHWQQKIWRHLTLSLTTLSLALTTLLLSHLFTPWIPFPAGQNPVQELHGWPQALQQAQTYQQQWAKPHHQPPLFAANWTQASRIAWYGRPQAAYVTDNRFDQFDLWFGNPPAGSDGIVIIPNYESSLKSFQQLTQPNPKRQQTPPPGQFEQCQTLPSLTLNYRPLLTHKTQRLVEYHYFYCQNYQPPHYSGWVSQLPNLTKWLPNNMTIPHEKSH